MRIIVTACAVLVSFSATAQPVVLDGGPPPLQYRSQASCVSALPEQINNDIRKYRDMGDSYANSSPVSPEMMISNYHIWLDRGIRRPDGKPWAVASTNRVCRNGVMQTMLTRMSQ